MTGCNKRESGMKSFLKNHYHFNALAISRDISSSFEKLRMIINILQKKRQVNRRQNANSKRISTHSGTLNALHNGVKLFMFKKSHFV